MLHIPYDTYQLFTLDRNSNQQGLEPESQHNRSILSFLFIPFWIPASELGLVDAFSKWEECVSAFPKPHISTHTSTYLNTRTCVLKMSLSLHTCSYRTDFPFVTPCVSTHAGCYGKDVSADIRHIWFGMLPLLQPSFLASSQASAILPRLNIMTSEMGRWSSYVISLTGTENSSKGWSICFAFMI